MLTNYNVPIVLDATHRTEASVETALPSGGNRDYVPLTPALVLWVSKNFLRSPDPR